MARPPKTTYEDARLIRALHKDGQEQIKRINDNQSARGLALKFNMSKSHIEKIIGGFRWKE